MPGGEADDLARLADGELLEIVRSLPRGSGRHETACELLVSRHDGLVRSCVWRYSRSPELAQDLGRVPAESDVARHLGVSGDALHAGHRRALARAAPA